MFKRHGFWVPLPAWFPRGRMRMISLLAVAWIFCAGVVSLSSFLSSPLCRWQLSLLFCRCDCDCAYCLLRRGVKVLPLPTESRIRQCTVRHEEPNFTNRELRVGMTQ